MGVGPSFNWNWWWIFCLIIAAPALGLAVLGLRAVRAERIELEQQRSDQQRQSAFAADQAIAGALSALEDDLHRIDLSGRPEDDNPDHSSSEPYLLTFDRNGAVVLPRERVYFGEQQHATDTSPEHWPLSIETAIEEAQAAEAQNRRAQATALYERIAGAEPRLREWARFCSARVRRQSGNRSAETEVERPELGRSEAVAPTGLPVALIECGYIEQLTTSERAAFTPLLTQTLESLRNGRWWLSFDQRRFYDSELRALLTSAGSEENATEDIRLEEMADIERVVRRSPPSRRDAVTRTFDTEGAGYYLTTWAPSSRNSDAWIGCSFPREGLSKLLDQILSPALSSRSSSAVLHDSNGHTMWTNTDDGLQVTAAEPLRSVNGWEIGLAAPPIPAWKQRRLLWYGFIALLVAMLLVGLGMTVRVVRREAALGRMQNEFIAAVSHEFMSPITIIRLLLERMTGGRTRDEASVVRYQAALNREIDRLERHVDRLLEVQKIQEGRKAYSFSKASLLEISQAAVDEFRAQAQARGIGLDLEVRGEITEIRADASALKGAIENLLDNAIKYSRAGTRIDVVVWATRQKTGVDVCDQGIGIEDEDLGRIFDRFYRGTLGRDQDAHGTGLGLWLVREAVEAHGGTVSVTSTPGEGSRFSLRLPIAATDSVAEHDHVEDAGPPVRIEIS